MSAPSLVMALTNLARLWRTRSCSDAIWSLVMGSWVAVAVVMFASKPPIRRDPTFF